jgi:hypothetical protein
MGAVDRRRLGPPEGPRGQGGSVIVTVLAVTMP